MITNVALLLYAIAKVALYCGFVPGILLAMLLNRFPAKVRSRSRGEMLRKPERAVSLIRRSNKPARRRFVA